MALSWAVVVGALLVGAALVLVFFVLLGGGGGVGVAVGVGRVARALGLASSAPGGSRGGRHGHGKRGGAAAAAAGKRRPDAASAAGAPSALRSAPRRLLTTLKGHSRPVTDISWSADGRAVASIAEDRTLQVHHRLGRGWAEREGVATVRVNVEYDHCTACSFGSETYIAAALSNRHLWILRILLNPAAGARGGRVAGRRASESLCRIATPHRADITDVHFAKTGRYIVTSSEETTVHLFRFNARSAQCVLLHSIDTNQMRNLRSAFSPDGMLFAVASWGSDVQVWGLRYAVDTRTHEKMQQELRGVARAFALAGHSSSVVGVAFSEDSQRVVTASRDATFRVWDVGVEWEIGASPRCVAAQATPGRVVLSCVAVHGGTVAAAHGSTLLLFDAETGALRDRIAGAHGAPIMALAFPAVQQERGANAPVVLASAGGSVTKVWNVA